MAFVALQHRSFATERAHRVRQLTELTTLGVCLSIALWAGPAQALTLEELIGTTLASHPAGKVQDAQVIAALAVNDAARWQYYPTPSLSIENTRTAPADPNQQRDGVVSLLRLQQPLWTGGRLTAGVDRAVANLDASRAAQDEVRQQLALRVVQAYGDWAGAQWRVTALERSLATHERLLAQVRRRIAQGASADSDLILADTRLKTVAADLSAATTQRHIALGRLWQLTAQPLAPEALASVNAAPKPFPVDVQRVIDTAIARHPSVLRAQAQAESRRTEVADRKAALSPEVFLRVERQHGNPANVSSAPFNRVVIGMATNFGAGLSVKSAIDAAKAQHSAALSDVQVQGLAVAEQVQSDHALASSADYRVQSLEASMTAAKSVAESFDRQFLAGRKTWLDVMNAARELSQAEVQLAEARSTRIVASWRLALISLGVDPVLAGAPR